MKKLLSFIAAALLMAATPVMANDFWSFSYSDIATGGTVAYGSGTFETLSGPGAILGISGTANGSNITGLSNWAAADNILSIPGGTISQGGISFATSSGTLWNIYVYSGTRILNSIGFPDGVVSLNSPLVSMTVTAVPEPETYALMLAGLGLVGTVVRRRKQKAMTA